MSTLAISYFTKFKIHVLSLDLHRKNLQDLWRLERCQFV